MPTVHQTAENTSTWVLVLSFAGLDAALLFFLRTADFGSPLLFLTGKRGSPPQLDDTEFQTGDSRLAQSGVAMGRAMQTAGTVAGLARFFPEATPVRLPVQLARTLQPGEPANFSESTVIEYGTPREVLFACKTPFEFADNIRVRNSDGSFDVEVEVVAVQYHPGNTVVAARFVSEVPNWIVKP
jgi:hypothetical protein